MIRKTSYTVLLLAGMVIAAPAWAQNPPSPALSPEVVRAMSTDEMLRKGEKWVQETGQTIRQVLDAMAEARKQNDFQKMNCIGQALTSLKGLMKLSDQNAISLREKTIAGDRVGAEHEYAKLWIARNKVDDLLAQARGCGGPSGETVYDGTTVVEVDFDDDLPWDDGRLGLSDPLINMEPPPSASPFY
jgi:hypothetical protein